MNRIDPRTILTFLICCAAIATPAARASKKTAKATTADGAPIRKVYIRSAAPDMANAAARQLTQDTCLTTVPTPKQADAVLDLGIALPSVGGGGAPAPDVFGSTPHAQTMGNDVSAQPQRSASANCSDTKGSSGCTGSYTGPAGDIAGQPSPELAGNPGTNFDVSLASPGETSQELWEPEANSKKSWSDQLRVAAGCPVCPHEHFDRRKFQTYRNWMQIQCPAMLPTPSTQ